MATFSMLQNSMYLTKLEILTIRTDQETLSQNRGVMMLILIRSTLTRQFSRKSQIEARKIMCC